MPDYAISLLFYVALLLLVLFAARSAHFAWRLRHEARRRRAAEQAAREAEARAAEPNGA